MENEIIGGLFNFIEKSSSPFHVIHNAAALLEQNGFVRLVEKNKWKIETGKKYYVTRNSSSIIAFKIPEKDFSGFSICAAHSDSPSFKIKENPEIKSCGVTQLNVEKYGGMLMHPWFDRPLSVAGRIFVKDGDKIRELLTDIDRNLVMIPNLAIHMNRDANDGHKISVQKELLPVLGMGNDIKLIDTVAESCSVKPDQILSYDLFLYNREKPCTWGNKEEFISAPKIDDLECAFACLTGFIEGAPRENVGLCCIFDNEETGSQSFQGAASTFLKDTLHRINFSLGRNDEDYLTAVANGFMISADNAHAVHPSYAEKADPVNRPEINGGIVIKYNAAQKYTTDASTSAVFKDICNKAGVPFQIFTNNSNVAGGSTLGNISMSQVSVPCVDIGLPQWAMHSPYESAGVKDVEYLVKAVKQFFSDR